MCKYCFSPKHKRGLSSETEQTPVHIISIPITSLRVLLVQIAEVSQLVYYITLDNTQFGAKEISTVLGYFGVFNSENNIHTTNCDETVSVFFKQVHFLLCLIVKHAIIATESLLNIAYTQGRI